MSDIFLSAWKIMRSEDQDMFQAGIFLLKINISTYLKIAIKIRFQIVHSTYLCFPARGHGVISRLVGLDPYKVLTPLDY